MLVGLIAAGTLIQWVLIRTAERKPGRAKDKAKGEAIDLDDRPGPGAAARKRAAQTGASDAPARSPRPKPDGRPKQPARGPADVRPTTPATL
jgi:hypothetical protein